MRDEDKPKEQLIAELVKVRQRIAVLEALEAEYKQIGELFRSLTNNSQSGVYILQDKVFCYVNPQFQRLTGYSEDELLGTDSLRLVVPEDRDMVKENARKMLKGELSSPYEYRILDKNGRVNWIMEMVTSIQYQGRRAILGHFIDNPKRGKAEERLLTAERLATLGQFSGNISHELRNPLGVISSSAYYLKTRLKDADEKVWEHLDRIKSSVDNATAVIQSLLDLTRMKAARLVRLDLIAITTDVIATAKVPVRVKVIRNFAEPEVLLNADREQLGIAFRNIIANAVEAMAGKGTLTVAVHTKDGQAEVSFADTGTGIAPENLDKIFQPLFSTKAKGIGFGLSIAKMVIERHGGTIEAKSAQGKGATLIIRLPLGVDKAEEA